MISIGKMPQACPMSVKTLRWYDQIGPLHPEYVDEKTGFRYCAPEQIEQILLIRRYKRFGFSLQEIGELLQASQTQIQKAPAHKLEEMQIQIESQRQRQEEIRQILSDRPERIFMNRTTELVKTEKTPVYALHAVTSIAEYGGLMSRLFEEADKNSSVCAARREPGISIRTLIRKNGTGSLLPVCPAGQANGEIGGDLCVRVLHTGNYSTLSESYGAALKWIEENGYAIVNAPYELYLSDPRTDPDPADWKTEIFSGHSKVVSGRSTGFCRATQPAMTKSEKQSSRNL
ncbi:GyrI-like domain-containing protein [Allobaculum sp. Allo2]|uniref:MerR family transcriptional regulator n=1 Tax=Allobaculum sp. Allo2 TaxID=2853432 RepID=UPI001F624831|nr:GyrI-like domain-containing protein [Allobaculum sp. Allo2]UNT93730.1 GyrI-like domain-containing protein [Allobaculum sp. Allo2]